MCRASAFSLSWAADANTTQGVSCFAEAASGDAAPDALRHGGLRRDHGHRSMNKAARAGNPTLGSKRRGAPVLTVGKPHCFGPQARQKSAGKPVVASFFGRLFGSLVR